MSCESFASVEFELFLPLLQDHVGLSHKRGLLSLLLLVLELGNVKTPYRKSCPRSLFRVLNLTPTSQTSGVNMLKRPISLIISSTGSKCHTIAWNVLQVSDVTFDPRFKVKRGKDIKKA